MDDLSLKKCIGENIARFRRGAGMTQAELAEKISYSDKSVSKWERGEGLPDIAVLKTLSELFGVSVNDLVYENTSPPEPRMSPEKKSRLFIPMLAGALVWLVATAAYLVLSLVLPEFSRGWVLFVFAVPVCCAVALIFLSIWWGVLPKVAVCTVLIWTLALAFWLGFNHLRDLSEVFYVAGALQLIVLIWFFYKFKFKKPGGSAKP